MLLIGSTNLTRTTATGDFFCPHCAAIRDYRLRARRPFLTIYFIPIVPVGPAEQYVQCTRCGTHSPTQSLDGGQSPSDGNGLPQVAEELFEAAAMIVVADGVISERQITALLELGKRLQIPGCDRERLGAICSSIRLNGILPTNFIHTAARTWNAEQRIEALKIFFLVATADELGERQVELLAWLRRQFDLGDKEYQSAIDAVVESGWNTIDWQLVDFVTPA